MKKVVEKEEKDEVEEKEAELRMVDEEPIGGPTPTQ